MSTALDISLAAPANQNSWDAFFDKHADASPYHLFAWGAAVAWAYGHKPYYLMARQQGKMVGGLPLIHLRVPFLINQLVALPFCDVGSCLTDDPAVTQRLLDEACVLASKLKATKLEIRGENSECEHDDRFLKLPTGKVRMMLALPSSGDALLASLKAKVRSQVKKAEKNGVQFRWAKANGLDSFYKVFSRNMRDLGSPVHSKKLFAGILKHYGDQTRIGLATYQDTCIGAGLILSTQEKTAIPWASTLRQYNHLAPNMLLYWNFLKYAADNGKKTFDFGRSTEGEGTYHFKKQWGCMPIPLTWYCHRLKGAGPEEEKTSGSNRQAAAKLWQKMPLALANTAGPVLRKYISL
ncbi:MAG: FemAB family PEP-CTERM system-associated protein [Desulfobulbaceae bacterium]|nr:FemAB family PEP-CTERM system-associated protein [Desulfobulbaceae bacterium]